MSDYLPSDVQEKILQRIPVRFLLTCRCVCKQWKTIIDSPEFKSSVIDSHHVLVRYKEGAFKNRQNIYLSVSDDYRIPRNIEVLTIPPAVKMLNGSLIVGSSMGLICIFGFCLEPRTAKFVLWNPSIRRTIDVEVAGLMYNLQESVFGFGVTGNNPKILLVRQFSQWKRKHVQTRKDGTVSLFSMKTMKWKNLQDLPSDSIQATSSQTVGRFLYFCAYDEITNENCINTFDLEYEKFHSLQVPNKLVTHPRKLLALSRLRDCLAIMEHKTDKHSCAIWVFDDVHKTFTKVYTIKAPHASIITMGFMIRGQPILKVRKDDQDAFQNSELAIYDPDNGHIISLDISAEGSTLSGTSYSETFVLYDCSKTQSY